VGTLPETARGRPAKDGLHKTSPAAIVADAADTAAVLALSDERDAWMRRLAEAYRDGYDDGRATACVNLAVMEDRRGRRRWWNEWWWAKVRRIVSNWETPGARMEQVMAEITADQKFVTAALRLRATKPQKLSPLQWCVLNRIHGERLDESEVV